MGIWGMGVLIFKLIHSKRALMVSALYVYTEMMSYGLINLPSHTKIEGNESSANQQSPKKTQQGSSLTGSAEI